MDRILKTLEHTDGLKPNKALRDPHCNACATANARRRPLKHTKCYNATTPAAEIGVTPAGLLSGELRAPGLGSADPPAADAESEWEHSESEDEGDLDLDEYEYQAPVAGTSTTAAPTPARNYAVLLTWLVIYGRTL